MISDPQFGKRYLQRAWSSPEASASLGLLSSLLYPYNLDPLSKNVKDLSSAINSTTHFQDDQLSIPVSYVSLPTDDGDEIVASSNGLILSFFKPISIFKEGFILRVSNPLTKQSVVIPELTLNDFLEVGFLVLPRDSSRTKWCLFDALLVVQDKANASIEIFCSVTGSWAAWEVKRCPGEVFDMSTVNAGFSYKGVLHWLCRKIGAVITYDPYNRPGRFGFIPLPRKRYPKSGYKSLIYSGDEQVLKYCEMGKCKSGEDRLLVWRLGDSSGNAVWWKEGKFSFPSLSRGCKRLMVALNPCNPRVLCRPYVIDKNVSRTTCSYKTVPMVISILCPTSLG